MYTYTYTRVQARGKRCTCTRIALRLDHGGVIFVPALRLHIRRRGEAVGDYSRADRRDVTGAAVVFSQAPWGRCPARALGSTSGQILWVSLLD